MPMYSFKCDSCKGIFDKYYRVDDKPLGTACKLCGTPNIKAWPIITKVNVGHIDQGPINSVAFGKTFKNEKDMKDYAKFHGHIPMENASIESVEKSFKNIEKEAQEKHYKEMAEGIEWNNLPAA